MSIFVTCEEANHTCDKNQYKEASFWELIKLNVHLAYCRVCREYTRKNLRLTKLFQKAKVQTMPKEEKALLKERLRQEMAK